RRPDARLGGCPARLLVSHSARGEHERRRAASRARHRRGASPRHGARHDLGNQTLGNRQIRRGGAALFAQRICGGADGKPPRARRVCREVARLAPGAVDIAGETTLTELAALIRRSSINLTNDSGPMHLAVALDRPVVSIFGPTDPVWIGPYGRAGAVLQAGVP